MKHFYPTRLLTLMAILGLVAFLANKSYAQNGWTLTGSVGVVNYYGDVSDNASFSFDGINPAGSIGLERKFGKIFVPQLNVTFTRLSDQKNYLDAEFETFYTEASLRLAIDVIGIFNENAKFELMPLAGISAALYDPTVNRISSGEAVNDAAHINEGESFGLGAVFGGRAGYKFNNNWRAFTGLEMRYLFTDQVDGYRGLNLPVNEESSNDWLSYIYVGVGYTFGKKEKEIFTEPVPQLADQPVEENSQDNEVNGQFTYQGKPKSGVKMDLFDENDTKMASSISDINGNFKFKDLKPERNYVVKLGDDDKGLFNDGKVYIINDDQERVALASKPGFNTYTFTQLSHDEVEDMDMLIETKPTTSMDGIFVYEELPAAGVKVYLMDEAGNRIDSTVTRSGGEFRFDRLDPDGTYFVKMAEEDMDKFPDADIYFVNNDDEPVMKARKGDDGVYNFDAKDEDEIASLETLTAEDGDVLFKKDTRQQPPVVVLDDVDPEEGDDQKDEPVVEDQPKVKDDPKPVASTNVSFEKETIYFRHNSFWISDNQQGTKGSIIAQKLNDNPGMRIRIEGWASPPGDDNYNLSLSQKRADKLKELLVSKYNINASRIEAVGKGEVSDKMSEEEARKARIVVIK